MPLNQYMLCYFIDNKAWGTYNETMKFPGPSFKGKDEAERWIIGQNARKDGFSFVLVPREDSEDESEGDSEDDTSQPSKGSDNDEELL